jgi:hypothetical protein
LLAERSRLLALSQPTFGNVFLLSEFLRQLQNFFIDFSLAAIRAQGLRRIVRSDRPRDRFPGCCLVAVIRSVCGVGLRQQLCQPLITTSARTGFTKHLWLASLRAVRTVLAVALHGPGSPIPATTAFSPLATSASHKAR